MGTRDRDYLTDPEESGEEKEKILAHKHPEDRFSAL